MKRKEIALKCLKATIIGLVLIFMYAPILVLAVFSFSSEDIIGASGEFSLVHYQKLFSDRAILTMIGNTLLLALLSAVLATLLGTLAAIGIHYNKRRIRTAINSISQIPVVNAEIVTALALAIMFAAVGLQRSYFTLLIGHMVISTPFVVLSVLPKLKQMDNSLYEAALDLGASPAKALFTVVIPQIIPGIISGFMLAVTLSLDDYIVTSYLKPASFDTISTYVFNATMRGNAHTASTLSSFWALTTILFVVILVIVISANLVGRGKKKEAKK